MCVGLGCQPPLESLLSSVKRHSPTAALHSPFPLTLNAQPPQNYPEDSPAGKVLGFLTGRIIWALQWDHIYSADYFLLLLALLGASLAACTVTNQWPAARVARRRCN